jgi:predicted membrane-bound mannosyltransferase
MRPSDEIAGARPALLDRSLPAILILVAVSLVPRLLALGSRPIWYDEAFRPLLRQGTVDVLRAAGSVGRSLD